MPMPLEEFYSVLGPMPLERSASQSRRTVHYSTQYSAERGAQTDVAVFASTVLEKGACYTVHNAGRAKIKIKITTHHPLTCHNIWGVVIWVSGGQAAP